ncbi:three-helix bundle dimerization domain-containing protein [Nocardia brasiliensis]|uniref:three-helix bundle dimerization domain-containing protein n=1 Tax=Nocardia brasiliensis TaxID=37326 RepID=UPI001EECB1D6|nr:hypothetical protein [Nocardia brasiliensis]
MDVPRRYVVVADAVREEQAIRQMTRRLIENFGDTHSPEHIEAVVAAGRKRFEGHPVRQFVPILVERFARRQLTPVPQEQEQAKTRKGVAAYRAAVDTDEVREPWSASRRFVPAVVSAAVAALVVVTVVAVALAVRQPSAPSRVAAPAAPLAVVRGVVGSEKMSLFQDQRVIDVLARHGLRAQVDSAGSRQIATSVDLTGYDFAFPSSEQAAERIQRQRNVSAKYLPFASPLAIATFTPIADLLTKAGVVHPGPVPTFDMGPYLRMVGNNTRWDQLAENTVYPTSKNVLISTTDPRSSNSAAMYLAIAGYVANNNTIVQGRSAEEDILPTVARLFVGQGYTQGSSEGPFETYLATGMGPTPLVWMYEAQFVDAAVRGLLKPRMTMLYPTPTILSRHTLVPFSEPGDRIGRLLATDPELQRLAAEHGFRTGAAEQFAAVAADHHVPVVPDLADVITTPTFDTLERLLDGVGKSYN